VTVIAGRYRLVARLGQGGMGVVWRAHDELLRRDIAVKELHVRIGVDGDFRARQVLREARAAARLRHPGVIAVHDVIVDDGRPVILMELVEGVSLAELVRAEGPLPEQRVAEIGARVLAALSVAHEQGVVHRDVKPANILLDGDRVVLTDFGIAAMTSDTTVTDSVVGSPEYLAPERINGEAATPATDLWSLGVTLCAALRGESPFQRSDTQATLAAVLTHEPAPIPRAPALWPVLATLLRKDPRQRPTATAVGARLATIAGLPTTSGKTRTATQPTAPGTTAETTGATTATTEATTTTTAGPAAPGTAEPSAATSDPKSVATTTTTTEPTTHGTAEPTTATSDPESAATTAADKPTTTSTAGPAATTNPAIARPVTTATANRTPVPRTRKPAALIAVLVLVAGGLWLVPRWLNHDTTGEEPEPTVSAPPGFTGHRGDGFTIAVPSDWFKDSSDERDDLTAILDSFRVAP
jgi:serine/threonine protein kinase